MPQDFWKGWFGPSLGAGRLIPMPRRWQGILIFLAMVLGIGACAAIFHTNPQEQRIAALTCIAIYAVIGNLTYDPDA